MFSTALQHMGQPDSRPTNTHISQEKGAMAEWLGRGLQNLVHRFNSGSRLHPSLLAALGASGGKAPHKSSEV